VAIDHPPQSAKAARPADLLALLDRLGVTHETVTHPPVFTVAESAELKASIPGLHTKNLFLKDKAGALWLICAEAHATIDLKALGKMLGASSRLSFASAETLFDRLGVTPGSVTLFALMNDRERAVRLVLDARLLQGSRVNFHPLSNDATTGVSPEGLRAFLRHTGHQPLVLAFDAQGAPARIDGWTGNLHVGADRFQD